MLFPTGLSNCPILEVVPVNVGSHCKKCLSYSKIFVATLGFTVIWIFAHQVHGPAYCGIFKIVTLFFMLYNHNVFTNFVNFAPYFMFFMETMDAMTNWIVRVYCFYQLEGSLLTHLP